MNDEDKAISYNPNSFETIKDKLLTIQFTPEGSTSVKPWKKNKYIKKLALEVKHCLEDLSIN